MLFRETPPARNAHPSTEETQMNSQKTIAPEVEQEITGAYALAVNGNLDEAERIYARLLDSGIEDPRVSGTLGAILLRKGKGNEARPLIEQSLQQDPSQPKAWLNLSAIFFNTGDFAKALEAIDRAIELAPPSAEVLNNKGVIMGALGDHESALTCLEKAIALKPDYVDALYNKGGILEKKGAAGDAAQCYAQVLERSPNHTSARYNLAILQTKANAVNRAIDNLTKVIELKPDFVDALLQRSKLYAAQKRTDEALADATQAETLSPERTDILLQKGKVLLQKGEPGDALPYLDRTCRLTPDDAVALVAQGVARFELGNHTEAIDLFDRAIHLDPGCAEAYNNKALAQQKLKLFAAAAENYETALKLKPDFPDAVFNHATLLGEMSLHEEALRRYDHLLRIAPEYVEGWKNKGAMLERLKRYDEAMECFDRAIDLCPSDAEAYFNASTTLIWKPDWNLALGYANRANKIDKEYPDALYVRALILMHLGLETHAQTDAEAAVALQPEHPLANYILGTIHDEAKHHQEALRHYEVAYAGKKDIEYLLGQIASLHMQLSDWSKFSGLLEQIQAGAEQGLSVCHPFFAHSLIDSPEFHRKVAELHYMQFRPGIDTYETPRHPENRRIHIAYFSSDMGAHPVGNLLAGVIEAHDREQFEITVFSFRNHWGLTRERIHKASERFVNAEFMTDEEIVDLARSLKVDIAIDLNGYTSGGRTGVFTRRAAPLQVNYIGFLGTMGSDCHDYIIGDPIILPIAHESFFSEKIIQLPSYQANDNRIVPPQPKKTRADYGLPDGTFVFCSFNANYKITPFVFSLWMDILKRTPGSVLWLHCKNETAIENLRATAAASGVDRERLVFARTVPYEEHLSRHRFADLFLDTNPYNAGATASNALYNGLPLVTLAGKSFGSRYGASLLTALGLEEQIAWTPDEYVDKCIRIATDKPYHESLKARLATNLETHSLFDTARFTGNLEKAYRAIHRRQVGGLPPAHIVPADLETDNFRH